MFPMFTKSVVPICKVPDVPFINGVVIPKDRGITIGDLIKGADNGSGFRGRKDNTGKYIYPQTIRKDNKSNCLVSINSEIIVLYNSHLSLLFSS